MNLKTMIVTTSLLASVPLANAASIKVANQDIELSGGISGAFLTASNTASVVHDNIMVTDALLELSSGKIREGQVGFTAAIGGFAAHTLYDGGMLRSYDLLIPGPTIPSDMPTPFHHGWLSVSPMDNLVLDIGVLATNIGYESAMSYTNANILRGLMWNAQPAFYRGIRGNYALDDINVYVEFNNDESQGANKTFALGATAKIDDMNIGGSFSYGAEGNNILDVVFSTVVEDIEVGANLDMYVIANPPFNADTSAFGLALYATPKFDDYLFPVRLEYVSNGNGNVFASSLLGNVGESAYSITVTPTMPFKKNGFVRADLGLLGTDSKIFFDKDGVSQNLQMTFALQVGYKF